MANNITIVDPNSNGPTNLEDLNIYVELNVKTINRSGNNPQASRFKKVAFIDGTMSNGKKSMTTNFTEVNTNMSQNKELETLGITSIDIDFNSSLAPLIIIKFVDVRGDSITAKGGTGKYDFFFKLPYPIFELKIKGYYGKMVTYCLHLTKYNTRFNPNNGSFEITTNFIGYTYAFLSDMLMGYLKGIVNTSEGLKRYATLTKDFTDKNNNKVEVPTLTQFMLDAGQLNSKLEEIKETNNYSKLVELTKLKENLDLVFLDFNSSLDLHAKRYGTGGAILDTTSNYISQDSDSFLTAVYCISVTTKQNEKRERLDDFKSIVKKINSSIKKLKEEFTGKGLDLSDLIRTLNDVENNAYAGNNGYGLRVGVYGEHTEVKFENKKLLFKNGNEFKKSELKNTPGVISTLKNSNVGNINNLIIYILNPAYAEYKKLVTNIESQVAKLLEIVSNEVKSKMGSTFQQFTPTVGNFIYMLTKHVDTFMSLLRDVTESSEIKNRSSLITNANKKGRFTDINGDIVYPFPKVIDNTVEKNESWMGTIDKNAPETKFINNLLEGIKRADQIEKSFLDSTLVNNSDWLPINGNDISSTLFKNEINPYKKLGAIGQPNDIELALSLRGIAYLLTTQGPDYDNSAIKSDIPSDNKSKSKNDLQNVAESEANNLYHCLITDATKLNLINKTPETIVTELITKLTEETEDFKVLTESQVLKEDGDYYEYVYTKDSDAGLVIPINGDLTVSSGNKLDRFFAELDADDYSYVNMTNSKNKNGVSIFTLDEWQDVSTKTISYKPEQDENTGVFIEDDDYDDIKKEAYRLVGNTNYRGTGNFREFTQYRDTKNKKEGFGINYLLMINSDFDFESTGTQIVDGSRPYNDRSDVGFDVKKLQENFSNLITKGSLNAVDSSVDAVHFKNQSWVDDPGLSLYFGCNKNDQSNKFYNEQVDPGKTEYFIEDIMIGNTHSNEYNISLFGSEFYNKQFDITVNKVTETNNKAKALLFLSGFPFKLDEGFDNFVNNILLSKPMVTNLPKPLVLLIGGLLWRSQQKEDPIYWYKNANNELTNGSGGKSTVVSLEKKDGVVRSVTIPLQTESLSTGIKNNFLPPNKDEEGYVTRPLLFITDTTDEETVTSGERVSRFYYNPVPFLNKPEPIKKLFIDEFLAWTSSENSSNDSWNFFRKNLEFFNGTPKQWDDTIDIIRDNLNANNESTGSTSMNYLSSNYTFFKNSLNENYWKKAVIIPAKEEATYNDQNRNIMVKLSRFSSVSGTVKDKLLEFLQDSFKLVSNTPIVWGGQVKAKFKKDDFNKYLTYFFKELQELDKAKIEEDKEKSDEQNGIFDGNSTEDIKINTYRNIKAICDKWITSDETDSCAYNHKGNDGFFNQFKIIDKKYNDISQKIILDSEAIINRLKGSLNTSFADTISSLLSDMNFDFHALPTYLNLTSETEIRDMFTPYNINKDASSSGPSFVCMYIGNLSKHLKLGTDAQFKNDGIDFKDSPNFNKINSVFAVTFGSQNQSYFKDVQIDQKEFSETDESLQVQDNLVKNGNAKKGTFIGQSLYNVYSTRAYNCSVTMLGNAVMQPLTYFNLQNVPMFNGAYIVKKVTHSITPNTMETRFEGSRVGNVDPPFIKDNYIYLSLLDDFTGFKFDGSSDGATSDNATNGNGGTIDDVNEDNFIAEGDEGKVDAEDFGVIFIS